MTKIPTLAEIASGRQAAEREYKAKMAFFDAAERLHEIMGAPADSESVPIRGIAAPSSWPSLSVESAESIKDKILAALVESWPVPLSVSAIAGLLRTRGGLRADYPATNVSPKVARYAEEGLVIQSPEGGWMITDEGQRYVRQKKIEGQP